jgi:hypothetical protein
MLIIVVITAMLRSILTIPIGHGISGAIAQRMPILVLPAEMALAMQEKLAQLVPVIVALVPALPLAALALVPIL